MVYGGARLGTYPPARESGWLGLSLQRGGTFHPLLASCRRRCQPASEPLLLLYWPHKAACAHSFWCKRERVFVVSTVLRGKV